MMSNEDIGIIGGTFNPIHNGHLAIADYFMEKCSLSQLFFVPTYISPFKVQTESAIGIDSQHRLKMLELAIHGRNGFSINCFEIEKQELSYTIDTINHFATQYTNKNLYLLIGSDHALKFQQWRDWQSILEKTQICVGIRKDAVIDEAVMLENLTYKEKKPLLLYSPFVEIYSTLVRDRVRNNKSIAHLVPSAVADYIQRNRLYK